MRLDFRYLTYDPAAFSTVGEIVGVDEEGFLLGRKINDSKIYRLKTYSSGAEGYYTWVYTKKGKIVYNWNPSG